MRIRSKLVALIAVPLLALTIAAAVGFRSQSSTIESAEEAVDRVAETEALHAAVLAIGQERWAVLVGDDEREAELVPATDAAIAQLGDVTATDERLAETMQEVVGLVDESRTADDATRPWLLTDASSALLAVPVDQARDYPTAESRNAAVVNRLAIRSLERREVAWLAYTEVADGVRRSPDEVLALFTEADAILGSAVDIADGSVSTDLDAVLQADASLALLELQTIALDDLAEGDTSVDSDDALEAVSAFRTVWTDAALERAAALEASVVGALDDANNVRSLFSLLAVVGVFVLAGLIFTIYRSIADPLEALLLRANKVANQELPELVYTLRYHDGSGDLPVAEPILTTSTDEIGELVDAFNGVQATAYELATEQALGRRNISDMFINLGRRNQQLLQRILSRLSELERHEEDPEKLRELFELDHVVTRMRRNAESLLALAGAHTSRQWTRPVSIENTVRAAFGEVEGYDRIDVAELDDCKVMGSVVADVSHLLAELLENALNFSDPSTPVTVSGIRDRGGYAITVADSGIGMSQNELSENNSRITDPPPLDQVPTKFLGLFVVGRLAERHEISVRLLEGPTRGIVARIELPSSLLASDEAQHATPAVAAPTEAELEQASQDEDWDDTEETTPTDDEANLAEADVSEGDDLDEGDDYEDDDAVEDGLRADPDGGEPTSPLEETHDLDAELAEMTADAAAPAAAVDTGGLPVRQKAGAASGAPAAEPATADTADGEPDSGGLPTRSKGKSLDSAAALPEQHKTVESRTATDSSETAADAFSTMMSSLSVGINRGMQDAKDSPRGKNRNDDKDGVDNDDD